MTERLRTRYHSVPGPRIRLPAAGCPRVSSCEHWVAKDLIMVNPTVLCDCSMLALLSVIQEKLAARMAEEEQAVN